MDGHLRPTLLGRLCQNRPKNGPHNVTSVLKITRAGPVCCRTNAVKAQNIKKTNNGVYSKHHYYFITEH